MAFQPESTTYDGGVLQLETATPVQGGVGGASNAPLLSLANRTAYLKQHVDAIEAASAGQAPLNSPAFTGSPTTPDVAAGDSSSKLANTKYVQQATGGILVKNVAGGANVNLTAAEVGYAIIVLTGILTASINVIVPSGAGKSDEWIFFNNTTGAFGVTVKTAAGTGVQVNQAQSYFLYCDETNVRAAGAANQSSLSTQKFTATAGQTNFPVVYTPGNLIVFKNGAFLTPTDDYVAVSGIDIGMSIGCAAGDEIVTHAFASFTASSAVAKAGDTMLGPLTLPSNPTQPLHAAPMQYVDAAKAACVGVGYLLARDEKATNTTGGNSVVGSQTRILNTLQANTIAGASLAANQITLPAGTYRVDAGAPHSINGGKANLYNVTDGAIQLLGMTDNGSIASSGDPIQQWSRVKGRFTIAAPKVFELRHWLSEAKTGGLGVQAVDGNVEIFSFVEILKEA